MDEKLNEKIKEINDIKTRISELEFFVKGCDECNAISKYNNKQNYTKGLSLSYFYWTGSDGMNNSVKLSKEEDIVNFIKHGKDGLLQTLHYQYEEINKLLK